MGLQHDPLASSGGGSSGGSDISTVGQITSFTNGTKYTVPANRVTRVDITIVDDISAGTIAIGGYSITSAFATGTKFTTYLTAGQTIVCTSVGSGNPLISYEEFILSGASGITAASQITSFSNGTKYTVPANRVARVDVFIQTVLGAGTIGVGGYTIGTTYPTGTKFVTYLKAGETIACASVGSGNPLISYLEYSI